MNAHGTHLLVNAVAFQLGWFVCVQGRATWALATAVLLLALHARVVLRDTREWTLLAAVTALGFVVDSAMIRAGVLVPANGAHWAPLWLVCIWLLLATTLAHSLAWLQRRLPLAVMLGAVAGPLAYVGGAQFGAARLGAGGVFGAWTSHIVLALCWAVLVPLLLWLAQRLVPPREVSA